MNKQANSAELVKVVEEMLSGATENGYDLSGLNNEELAADMIDNSGLSQIVESVYGAAADVPQIVVRILEEVRL